MNYLSVAARDLRTGDVLTGSGFTVTHGAWRGVRTPANKVEIEGFYPGDKTRRVQWNRYTTVTIVRENA